MRLNRTSEWKVMTIWISWELLLFIFKRLDISWASSIHPSQKLWPSDIAESFRVQFQASPYIVRLNRTSKWKVMTIWITREHLLFIFQHLDISWASHIHPSQTLWPFDFAKSFRVQFLASWYIMRLNWTSEWKVMTIFEHLDISWASHIDPIKKLWPFEFTESFHVQFWSV